MDPDPHQNVMDPEHCLLYITVIPEMCRFGMSAANHFCDKPLPKYLDLKTVLIYCPSPVQCTCSMILYVFVLYLTLLYCVLCGPVRQLRSALFLH